MPKRNPLAGMLVARFSPTKHDERMLREARIFSGSGKKLGAYELGVLEQAQLLKRLTSPEGRLAFMKQQVEDYASVSRHSKEQKLRNLRSLLKSKKAPRGLKPAINKAILRLES